MDGRTRCLPGRTREGEAVSKPSDASMLRARELFETLLQMEKEKK